LADRVTLIAGHNGIGKSTILGLIANGSGVRGEGFQSYLNRAFEANIHEIVHLDHKREFEDYKSNPDLFPLTYLDYDLDEESLIKRCSITSTTRKAGPQVRVVPRNQPYDKATTADGVLSVGKDAKVTSTGSRSFDLTKRAISSSVSSREPTRSRSAGEGPERPFSQKSK
jgi:hypothetical protein